MIKINLNSIITKLAGYNQPGGLNALTAARLGLETLSMKQAVALIGSAAYTKKAEFTKISQGLKALSKIRNG